ncbi:MAG: 2-phospho-L-lactate guanylyltransferase [Dehalococcoidia bacterium]|nr:2-phospho-L-lactate guanylyltransferase [Dehalococcoidia bacterium]
MRDCWAIVPVKHLDTGKSRLSSSLGLADRVSLSLEMLGRVLDAASEIRELNILVISPDDRALGLAAKAGANTLEDRWRGLNRSLKGAATWCAQRGARSLLVLHADLPLLRSDDIKALIGLGNPAPSVVLAPSRREDGTNALFTNPPGIIPFAFGAGSFKTHLKLAAEQQIWTMVYRSPTVALDIDTEEDLEVFRSQVPAHTGAPV